MKDNWLHDRLRLLKGIVFQYLQQLKNNPNAECSVLSSLSQINAKIAECNKKIVKDSVSRIKKIKSLSEEIQQKKEEYYKSRA